MHTSPEQEALEQKKNNSNEILNRLSNLRFLCQENEEEDDDGKASKAHNVYRCGRWGGCRTHTSHTLTYTACMGSGARMMRVL